MAFGIAVTAVGVTQIATGATGYIIRVGLSSVDVRRVHQAMAENTISSEFSDGITEATELEVLYGYLDSTDPGVPDVAWAQSGEAVDVFLKDSNFPYNANTRIGIWMYQNATNPTAIVGSQFADIPESSKLLCKYLILDDMYRNLLRKAVPQKVLSGLHAERTRLGV